MGEEDTSIDEKRVYADRSGATTAFVATRAGLARVDVSADIVGEFALAERCTARDVAAGDGHLAVATAEDVLVRTPTGLEPTGFGPADAVGYDDGRLLAAGNGRIAGKDDDGWCTLADLGDVTAIDGDLVATRDGLYRPDGTHVGLDDATDVATAARPMAATASGLYRLANGWMTALDGGFDVVTARQGVAHAARADTLYERTADGEWTAVDLPVAEPIVDVAYGEGTYVLTEPGTILATVGEGWRHRSLGLPGAAAIAVPAP